ncbi:MAG: XRE family transcriptional regulator [Methylococcales bacterium]|nr:XRE family transcriptional regulator [Methylococcales bacterium]
MSLGIRVKETRERRGLTLAELATKVGGITGQAIQQIESGSTLHPRKLEQRAAALGVRQEWLLVGSDDCANVLANDKIISDIIYNLPYLTSSEQAEIAKYVVEMANRNKSVLNELSNRWQADTNPHEV